MGYVLAGGGLAPWGQAAAFIIGLYVFVSIIVGLALTAALMFLFAWIREKAELIKKLRPMILEMNEALEASRRGDPLPPEVADNKIVATVARVPRAAATLPARASSIEQKVERGSDRVAAAVIEFRARTEMVKGMAKAFFLPGLTRRRAAVPVEQIERVKREEVVEPQREEVVAAERPGEEPYLEQEIVIRSR
jgi:hypothetical protein